MEPVVGIVVGSQLDLKVMDEAAVLLEKFGVPFEQDVLNAYREPDRVARYASEAEGRGLQVVIAGDSRSAHLPGMIASYATLPVIGVPISAPPFQGTDAVYAILQPPRGVPVATVGVDAASNAAVLAVQMLAIGDADLREQLVGFKQQLAEGLRL